MSNLERTFIAGEILKKKLQLLSWLLVLND